MRNFIIQLLWLDAPITWFYAGDRFTTNSKDACDWIHREDAEKWVQEHVQPTLFPGYEAVVTTR